MEIGGRAVDLTHDDHRVLVRCTTRLLKAIGTPTASLVDVTHSDQDWYASLLWLSGRKCILLTHAGTLFSVFVPGVRAVDLRPFGRLVGRAIETALRSQGLAASTLGDLEPERVRRARTADRSVLGWMNDLALHCRYAMADSGGLDQVDAD